MFRATADCSIAFSLLLSVRHH